MLLVAKQPHLRFPTPVPPLAPFNCQKPSIRSLLGNICRGGEGVLSGGLASEHITNVFLLAVAH